MIRSLLVVAVLLGMFAPPARAGSREITIVNETDGVIRGVYATEVGDDNWRTDLMRDNIQAGRTAVLKLPTSACAYDIRVLLELRPAELLLMNQDVCKMPVISIDRNHGRHTEREAR